MKKINYALDFISHTKYGNVNKLLKEIPRDKITMDGTVASKDAIIQSPEQFKKTKIGGCIEHALYLGKELNNEEPIYIQILCRSRYFGHTIYGYIKNNEIYIIDRTSSRNCINKKFNSFGEIYNFYKNDILKANSLDFFAVYRNIDFLIGTPTRTWKSTSFSNIDKAIYYKGDDFNMNKKWNVDNFKTMQSITEEINRIESIERLNESSDIVKNVADKQIYLLKSKLNTLTEASTEETTFLNNTRSDYQGELKAIKDYEAHADTAEKAGFKDAAEVLRDIAGEEKVHCGELQKVLDKYDTEHEKAIEDGKKEAEDDLKESMELVEFKQFLKNPDFYNRLVTITESVLDPINKERCKEIFTNNIMKANVKSFIMNIIKDFDKQVNFPIGVRNVYLIGSSSGYQYSQTSDIDIEVETNISEEQLKDIIKIIPKGTLLPGTQKPINLFVIPKNKDYDFKNAENVYDIKKNKWLKQTEKSDTKVPYQYIKDLSKFFMNGCDLALSKYEQDKKEYEEYCGLNPDTQEISEKEKMEAIDRKLIDLRNDLDTIKMAHHVIFAFEQEGYNNYPFRVNIEMQNKDPRYSVNNLVYKMIDRFGYLDKMNKIVKECEALLKKTI